MHVISCILWGSFSYRSFIFIHFDAVSACDELITVSNPMIAALVGRRQQEASASAVSRPHAEIPTP